MSRGVPIDPERYQEMVERHAAAAREARSESRRHFARFLVEVLVATLFGLVMMGLAIETADAALGRVWWYGGQIVWLAGVAVAIWRARARAAERGDLGPPV